MSRLCTPLLYTPLSPRSGGKGAGDRGESSPPVTPAVFLPSNLFMLRNFPFGTFSLFAILSTATGIGHAQTVPEPFLDLPARPPAASAHFCTAAELLRYDPATNGILFVVAPERGRDTPEYRARLSGMTLTRFADEQGLRTVAAPGIRTLAPRGMVTITAKPEAADPLAALVASDRFRLLLGTLTPQQWQTAGSDTGIGRGDLTKEQKPIFDGLLPAEGLCVQTMRAQPSTHMPGRMEWKPTKDGVIIPANDVRLRLRRRTFLTLVAPSGEAQLTDPFFGEPHTEAEGTERDQITDNFLIRSEQEGNDLSGTYRAFGVTIARTEPNRAKPSDLDLNAPAFSVPLHLDGSQKTIGDLIALCARETRFTLLADRRFAALPLAWRVSPGGQTASAGSVLRLLCRALTGTFRRLDAPGANPLFLLTDDREGYGTRLARLRLWAEHAADEREALLKKADKSAAASDPLAHLRFAANDSLALPAPLGASLDTAYRKGESDGVPVKTADLPIELRDEAIKEIAEQQKENPKITTERVRLRAMMVCDYVLPDKRTFENQLGNNLSYDYLSRVAAPAPSHSPFPKPPSPDTPPPALPQTASNRVLVLPLPTSDAAINAVLTLAHRKGFTEAWFSTALHDAHTPDRLRNAVAAGERAGIRVGASVSWLKRGKGETWGTEDINLAGETGEQYITREFARVEAQAESESNYTPDEMAVIKQIIDKVMVAYFSRWTVPDAALARAPLAAVLAVPHLSALALTDFAAPGWNTDSEESNGYAPGDALGYTLETRIACVRAEGFDPIDVYDNSAKLPFTLPIFYDAAANLTPVGHFRAQTVAHEHAALMEPLKNSGVPVYEESITPVFTGIVGSFTRYGTASPPVPLVVYRPMMEWIPAAVAQAAVQAIGKQQTGFVVDFSHEPLADVTRYLNAFADKR